VTGSCGHGNEPSDSTKGFEFLDKLSDSQLLKRTLALWIELVNENQVGQDVYQVLSDALK